MISQSNTEHLASWFDAHSSNPYPTKAEKIILMEATGLTKQQLQWWFDDARAKQRKAAGNESKPRSKLSPLTTEYLRNWFDEHMTVENPYPTKEEKEEIMAACDGLTLQQLDKWFKSAREKMRGPPEQRGGKLPAFSVEYLKDWFEQHSEYPYPTKDERELILNDTGLTMVQLRKWLERARAAQRNGGKQTQKRGVSESELERPPKKGKIETDIEELPESDSAVFESLSHTINYQDTSTIANVRQPASHERCVKKVANNHDSAEKEAEDSEIEDAPEPGNQDTYTIANVKLPAAHERYMNEVADNHDSAEEETEEKESPGDEIEDAPEPGSTNGTRTKERFARSTNEYLENWLIEHSSKPYPTRRERDELMSVTGMSEKQLSNWLHHTRKKLGIVSNRNKLDKTPLQTWLDDNKDNPFPTEETRSELAAATGLTNKQVCRWFETARLRLRITSGDQKSLRSRRPNISQSSIENLESWFRDHEADPYPSPEEKEALMAATGINPEQLKFWFKRKRKEQREIAGEQTKRRNQYPQSSCKYLNERYDEHLPHPFPSEEDLVQIKAATSLTDEQIKMWFKNKRAQRKKETGESLAPKQTVAQSYLHDWFSKHSNKYPTTEEKTEIMAATGMSMKQVNEWFKRERSKQGASTYRFPSSSVEYLNNWYEEHSSRPTKKDKEEIAAAIGLNEQQITSWFRNKRSSQEKSENESKADVAEAT